MLLHVGAFPITYMYVRVHVNKWMMRMNVSMVSCVEHEKNQSDRTFFEPISCVSGKI